MAHHNLLKQSLVGVCKKRRKPTQKDIENNTYTPVVNLKSVTLAFNYFRSDVTRTTARCESHSTLKEASQSKISYLDNRMLVFCLVE